MLILGFVASGLVQGALAGFNSLAFVMLWRTTRVVNLAQPAMGLVGGVLTGLLVRVAGWSFWAAAPAGLLTGALLGFAAELAVFRRLREAPRAVVLVATVGLAALFAAIQTALPFAVTGRTLPTYTVSLGMTLDIGPVRLLGGDLLVLMLFPVVLCGVGWFLYRTRTGLEALALGADSERAQSLGVRATVVRSVVWTVAGIIASVSGILSIPVLGFNLAGGLGPVVLVLALAPAVLAGMRSLAGAAAGALGIGVAFSLVHHYVTRSGVAEIVFAFALLVAVAVQGRRFGRAETAARASSWEAGATVRPLPWRVASRLRPLSIASSCAVALVAAVVPVFLSPGRRVLYASSAALAIGALSCACAWMLAGEVPLGNWGIAGIGAAVTLLTPGPLVARILLAAVACAALGALLGAASRRRDNLSYAVLGLVVAAAAPVALLLIGDRALAASPLPVGAAGAAVAVLAAALVARVRSSMRGLRMAAARDDPDRAPHLGAHVLGSRVQALALSGALAGVAGVLYAASLPAGLAPGAFDPARSLDILAMAVIGGLGSPLGTILAAAALQLVRFGVPAPWRDFASGIGVLVVVLARPRGIAGAVRAVRDKVAA